MKLVGGGLLSTGPTPSSFLLILMRQALRTHVLPSVSRNSTDAHGPIEQGGGGIMAYILKHLTLIFKTTGRIFQDPCECTMSYLL